MNKIKLSIYRHSKICKNGKNYVYILIRNTITNKRKLINILSLDPKFWDKKKLKVKKTFQNHSEYNKKITTTLEALELIILKFEKVEKYYDEQSVYDAYLNRNYKSTLKNAFNLKIETLDNSEDFGNREVYKTTRNFYSKILPENIDITQISEDLIISGLNKYLSTKSISNATIRMYLRTLRALLIWTSKRYRGWNLKILEVQSIIDLYPENAVKKIPLTVDEISILLKDSIPKDENERLYLNLFHLSFLLLGVNFIDLLHLTHNDIVKNVNGNYVVFKRRKTSKTSSIGKEKVILPIEQAFFDIIDKINNGNNHPVKILNVGDPNRTDTKYYRNLGKKLRKRINSFMNSEAKRLGIEKHLNLQLLRITTGTILYDNESVNNNELMKLFNHSSFETTKKYYINSNKIKTKHGTTKVLYDKI